MVVHNFTRLHNRSW